MSLTTLATPIFLRAFCHVAETSQLRSLYLEKWLDIQGFANFTTAHFIAKSYAFELYLKILFLPFVTLCR